MRMCAGHLTTIGLTLCVSALTAACDPPPPVVATVDTLCVSTARYHATDEQRAAFKVQRAVWEPLVDWLTTFNRVRDERCLKSSPY